jgi:hypothetical protein
VSETGCEGRAGSVFDFVQSEHRRRHVRVSDKDGHEPVRDSDTDRRRTVIVTIRRHRP